MIKVTDISDEKNPRRILVNPKSIYMLELDSIDEKHYIALNGYGITVTKEDLKKLLVEIAPDMLMI